MKRVLKPGVGSTIQEFVSEQQKIDAEKPEGDRRGFEMGDVNVACESLYKSRHVLIHQSLTGYLLYMHRNIDILGDNLQDHHIAQSDFVSEATKIFTWNLTQ